MCSVSAGGVFRHIVNNGMSDKIHVKSRRDVHEAFQARAKNQRALCARLNWTAATYERNNELFIRYLHALRELRNKKTHTHRRASMAASAKTHFDTYQAYCDAAETARHTGQFPDGRDYEDEAFERIYNTDWDEGHGHIPISESDWKLESPELKRALEEALAFEIQEADILQKFDEIGGSTVWGPLEWPVYALNTYITDEDIQRQTKEYEDETRQIAYQMSELYPERTPEENWYAAESVMSNFMEIEAEMRTWDQPASQ